MFVYVISWKIRFLLVNSISEYRIYFSFEMKKKNKFICSVADRNQNRNRYNNTNIKWNYRWFDLYLNEWWIYMVYLKAKRKTKTFKTKIYLFS